MSFLVTWGPAILALGFLIVVHEAGHYFVARWCKMRVERFSIGFGPGILKRTGKSGTVFQLAPIPFGGFVEIRGMNIAEEVDPADELAYPNRPVWQRFLTILAGPATNYISAVVLAVFLYGIRGVDVEGSYHIIGTSDGGAAVGKFEPGDRIVAIDDKPMFSPGAGQIGDAIDAKKGAPIKVTFWRGYDRLDVTITPTPAVDKDHDNKLVRYNPNDKSKTCDTLGPDCWQHYQMGVSLEQDVRDVSLVTAIGIAIEYPYIQTKAILGGLKDIITGKEKADPGGPVRIVGEFQKAFSAGWVTGMKLLMLLSVYLGLFNLLPLPALDGGRLVFLGYEMVTRRRANPKIETMVHMGGIMVLMIVMVLVTLHDFSVI